MLKVTGVDLNIEDYGLDVCATWSAIQGLTDALDNICSKYKTLVICDEHHHAAVDAAWGKGANSAFRNAQHSLILSGTPVRSDGEEPVWFAYDDAGKIDHPSEGTYTLTYGEAVSLHYCRPITFHRHEGKFNVSFADETINVSGTESEFPEKLKIPALQAALDYYRLACTPMFLADKQTPDLNSYQGTMLEFGRAKLAEVRYRMPDAGGLVIAPNIYTAEQMAVMLEKLDGEKPTIVHSQIANAENKIKAFRVCGQSS